MRVMGLDVGTKTVGVAVSDALRLTAQAVTTIRRTNQKKDMEALRALATEREVTRVIIGLPLNMDGSEGHRAEHCRKFGALLHATTQLEIIYWDERLTTVAAQRALLEADVSRQKRREVIDQVAACLILQGWLDAQQKPEAP